MFERGFRKTPPKPYLYSEPVPEFDGETSLSGRCPPQCLGNGIGRCGLGESERSQFRLGQTHRDCRQGRRPRSSLRRSPGIAPASSIPATCGSGNMEPNGKLASTGVCLAKAGEEYVVYSAVGGSFTVDLSAARKMPRCKFAGTIRGPASL